MLRAIEGAVHNAAHAHPEYQISSKFARGIANCASEDAEKSSGRKGSRPGRDAAPSAVLVTRDNIVLMQKS